ncbi:MAG: hypothetical protein O3A53_09890 [Acidobacteria bacterium]|nr:hypothetical protein [Acidobacteriota bacterium]MDA1235103.1 hypothetical protein [Acidobacteriota bacterium]
MQKLLMRIAFLLLAVSCVLAAQDRVMVGDNIFVAADEELEDVVCVGCSIEVHGRAGDVVAIGGKITVAEGAVVRDIVAIAGGLEMRGESRDAVSILGGSDIYGPVDGDLVAVIGGLRLHEGASVDGDAVSVLGGFERAPGIPIEGEVVQVGPAMGGIAGVAASGIVFLIIVALLLALAIWPVVSFICFAIMGPQRVGVVASTVNERAGMCFLVGLGSWIASILLSVMIPIMFFWMPGGMESVVTLAFFVTAAVGYTGVGYWVGRGMIRGGSGVGATILGSILITFIQAIPVIGWFIAFPIFGWLSLGAAIVSGFGTSADWLFPRTTRDVIARPAI